MTGQSLARCCWLHSRPVSGRMGFESPRKPKIKMKADSRISVTANPTQFICYPYGAIGCSKLSLPSSSIRHPNIYGL